MIEPFLADQGLFKVATRLEVHRPLQGRGGGW
jgi:hypothetical protein